MNFNLEILASGAEFLAPLQRVAPQLEKKDSKISQGRKLWNFRPREILASGAEFPA
jgi:hypothetical protein